MSHKIILETKRLKLKPFSKEDAKLFYKLSIDPFIRKYLWDDVRIPFSLAQEILDKNNEYFEQHGFGLWKMEEKKGEEIIGYTGLWYFFQEEKPQLIYAILEKYTKQGLATEAAKKILDYAVEQLKFTYLVASTDEDNLESMKVAERIGMNRREKKIIDGKSTVFFELSRN